MVVTRNNVQSQRDFAVAASRVIADTERVKALVTNEGLKVMGLTELDLEFAVHELKKHFKAIRCGSPQVTYDSGPPLMEPYYRAIVDTPEDCWGTVMSDMASRRAQITAISDIPIGKRFVAAVPVSECFGYSTALRGLTKNRGTYVFEFSHYGRVGGDDVA